MAHLEPHLTLKGMQARWDAAPTELERQRWDILCRLVETPDLQAVAQQVGVSDQKVRALLRRYNEGGPGAVAHGNLGRVAENRRLLTREQEAELRAWMPGWPRGGLATSNWRPGSPSGAGRRRIPHRCGSTAGAARATRGRGGKRGEALTLHKS